MNELEKQCLETFASWLKSLASDVQTVASVLTQEECPPEVREPLVGALFYLLRSLDLIDDGIESLGFLDDVFVLRLAAAQAGEQAPPEIVELAQQSVLLREFLAEAGLEARFLAYLLSLPTLSVAGQSAQDIAQSPERQQEFLAEVETWARRYEAPSFLPDPKNLTKLRSFLQAKLPSAE